MRVLFIDLDQASVRVLDSFLQKCGVPAEEAIETPTQLQSALDETASVMVSVDVAKGRIIDQAAAILDTKRDKTSRRSL